MTAADSHGPLDDDDYPAYTMGRAAEMLGTTQGFLRALGEARLITPLRSEGGHRRYSRYQLRIAARARNWSTTGPPSRPPAASSSSKTSSKRPSASTPNTATPPNPRTRRPRPEAARTGSSPKSFAAPARRAARRHHHGSDGPWTRALPEQPDGLDDDQLTGWPAM